MASQSTFRLGDWVADWGVQFGTSGARGLVANMTSDVCHAYASAFLIAVARGARRVVIGHDLRPSSPRIAAACADAARQAGVEPVFVGALPTPAIAHYAASLGAPAIVVTGSHIPFDRNGIKFYRAQGEITKPDEQAMLDAQVRAVEDFEPSALPPVAPAAVSQWIGRYVDFCGPGALAGLRIAVYEHSSVARDLLRTILERLGASVLSLGRTDTFVPIDTEAVRPEDVEQAARWADAHRFDAILSTDGDADRPLIGDERGRWLRGDVVGILCARWLGADTVATPVSSNTAVERCGAFARVLRTRIGSPYVIEAMETAAAGDAAGVVVGYEANGGFLLGTAVQRGGRRLDALPTRDAILPMLALLLAAREQGLKLSALAADLPARFTASDRLQAFDGARSRALIAVLERDLALAARTLAPDSGPVVAVDTTDGLRVSFACGDIVHLRPSGNAPELRCYVEADDPARAGQLCSECLARIADGGDCAIDPVRPQA